MYQVYQEKPRYDLRLNPPEIMTLEEVAVYLNVSAPIIRNAMETRNFPFRNIGDRCYRFSKTAVDRWMQENE